MCSLQGNKEITASKPRSSFSMKVSILLGPRKMQALTVLQDTVKRLKNLIVNQPYNTV